MFLGNKDETLWASSCGASIATRYLVLVGRPALRGRLVENHYGFALAALARSHNGIPKSWFKLTDRSLLARKVGQSIRRYVVMGCAARIERYGH